MPNIPGLTGYNQPDVFSRVRTMRRAVSIPGGLRVLSIVGEGEREEVIIDSAKGGGQDGFNPDFSSPSDGYGRFFRTAVYPLVENRTTLHLNGGSLRLLEDTIDLAGFPSEYDARIDPETGKIELQGAALVDQGGQFYRAGTGNTGDGYRAASRCSTTTPRPRPGPSAARASSGTAMARRAGGRPVSSPPAA